MVPICFTKEGCREPVGRTSLQSPITSNAVRMAAFRVHHPHWSLHDLRRTARTNFSDLTVHIAEDTGHKPGGRFMTRAII